MGEGFDGPTRAGTPQPAAGDAANVFLGIANAADLSDTAKVSAFNAGAQRIHDLAAGQQFAINEEGMQAYIALCDTFLDGHARQMTDSVVISQQMPSLGSDAYATEVATFSEKAVGGDDRSLINNISLARDGYRTLRDAFTIARANYDQMEAESTTAFKDLNSS